MVSSHDGSVGESDSIQGGAAQPIGPDSPSWKPSRSATDPSISLKDGYCEVLVPEAFLAFGVESSPCGGWISIGE